MQLLPIDIQGENYAIETTFIVEIIPIVKVIEIQDLKKPIIGVINYRGNIIPLIDFNLIISDILSNKLFSTRIVIINFNQIQFALLIENITDILEFNQENKIKSNINYQLSEFIKDYINVNGKIYKILNLAYFLNLIK